MSSRCALGFHNWKFKYLKKSSCEIQALCTRCGKTRGPVQTRHQWKKIYLNPGSCEIQIVCKRCGLEKEPVEITHQWAWIDETPCFQKQVCRHCGISGDTNEKDHIWQWRFTKPNTFLRQEVCSNCGIIGQSDDTGKQKWPSLASNAKKQQYLKLQQALHDLNASQGIWKIESSAPEWDAKGKSQTTIIRSEVFIERSTLDSTNMPVSGIKGDFGALVFYPGQISLVTNFPGKTDETFSASYADCLVGISYTHFSETGIAIPSDTELVDYEWLYAQDDGSPDPSYTDNRRIPILKYAEVHISCVNDSWVFLVSNINHAVNLVDSLSEYISGKPLGSTRSAEERSQTIFSLQDTETPYDVLGVEQGASLEEITSAYRKLALENHPDRVAGLADAFRELAEQNMKRINAAYDTLKKDL